MNIMKSCIFLVLFASTQLALASTNQNLSKLREEVRLAATDHLSEIYGRNEVKSNIDLQVANLDSRLRLSECSHSLKMQIQKTAYGSRNLSVKVNCLTGSRWTIFVPVTVDIYREVAVITKSLSKGHLISKDEIQLQRVNTSSISQNYVEDAANVLGMELKRSLTSGSIVKLSDIREPDLVRKGESVEVTYRGGSITVSSAGTALSNGHMGQSIKILNTQSRRIIDARVVGHGLTEVR